MTTKLTAQQIASSLVSQVKSGEVKLSTLQWSFADGTPVTIDLAVLIENAGVDLVADSIVLPKEPDPKGTTEGLAFDKDGMKRALTCFVAMRDERMGVNMLTTRADALIQSLTTSTRDDVRRHAKVAAHGFDMLFARKPRDDVKVDLAVGSLNTLLGIAQLDAVRSKGTAKVA